MKNLHRDWLSIWRNLSFGATCAVCAERGSPATLTWKHLQEDHKELGLVDLADTISDQARAALYGNFQHEKMRDILNAIKAHSSAYKGIKAPSK